MTKRVHAMLIQSERRMVRALYEACMEEHFRAPVRNRNEVLKVGAGGIPADMGNRYRLDRHRFYSCYPGRLYRNEVSFSTS